MPKHPSKISTTLVSRYASQRANLIVTNQQLDEISNGSTRRSHEIWDNTHDGILIANGDHIAAGIRGIFRTAEPSPTISSPATRTVASPEGSPHGSAMELTVPCVVWPSSQLNSPLLA